MRNSLPVLPRRTVRVLYFLGGLLLTALLLATVFVQFHLDPFVKNRLETLVETGSGGLYRLEIDRISINPLTATAVARHVRIVTDSVRWDSVHRAQPAKAPLKIALDIDKIVLSDLGWFRYWRHGHARVGGIEFVGPRVSVIAVKDSVLEVEPRNTDTITNRLINRLPRLLKPHATSLEIGTVAVRQGAFDYQTIHRRASTHQRADSIDWVLTRVRVADSDTTATGKAFYAENVYFRLTNYDLETPGGEYRCRVGEVELLSVDQLLRLTRVDVKSQPAAAYRRTRYDLEASELLVRGLNLFRALHRDEWVAQQVSIQQPQLTVNIDKNLPKNTRKKLMPNELMQELSVFLDIDSVLVRNGRVLYRESQGDGNRGELSFDHAYVTVLHLSNDRTSPRTTHIAAQTRLAGEGDLTVNMELPLLEPQFACSYNAQLRNLPVTALNGLLAGPGKMRLENGHINELKLQASVRDNVVTGHLEAAYGGLRISVLDERTGKSKPLLSMLANLVLRNNNKRNSTLRPFKTAEIRYARQPDDSFLRFIWRSARGGLLETLLPPGMSVPEPGA